MFMMTWLITVAWMPPEVNSSFGIYVDPKWDIEPVVVGLYPSLALDSLDRPRFAYFDGEDLEYAFWDGSDWITQVVDTDGYTGRYPSMILDANDNPYISYNAFSGTSYLRVAHWNGSSWDIQTADGQSYTGWYTSICLDSSGYPRVAHDDYMYDNLRYSSWNGSSWTSETVDDQGRVGMYTSLALDDSNRAHISYFRYFYDLMGSLMYAVETPSGWQIEKVDTPGGAYSSIAVDRSGGVHIAYNYDNDYLKYARWTLDSGWSYEIVDGPDSGVLNSKGVHNSIALDKDGNPCILYMQVFPDVNMTGYWFARKEGSTWQKELIAMAYGIAFSNFPNTVANHSLQIGSDGCPHAVFKMPTDLPGYGSYVFYAKRRCETQQTRETRRSPGDVLIVSGSTARIQLESPGWMKVYDIAGRTRRSWQLNPGQNKVLWSQGLETGIYLLRVGVGNTTLDTKTGIKTN